MIDDDKPISEEVLLAFLGMLFEEWGRQRDLHGKKSAEGEVVNQSISWLVRLIGVLTVERTSVAA